jgi:regulator of nonsense transcripts 3
MPTSTPVLEALKAEKSAHIDKDATQMKHSHQKDATQASKKDDSKKMTAAASGAASEAKQGGDSTVPLRKQACEKDCGRRSSRSESVRKGWLYDAAEDWKRTRCSF